MGITRLVRGLAVAAASLVLLGAGPMTAAAGSPVVANLSVRGLQIGATTTVVIDGTDLGAAPRLLFAFAARQKLLPGSTDKQARFEVTLGQEVVPGYYHLFVLGPGGVSAPVVMAVDPLPQRPMTASAESLPVAWHGMVNGSSVVEKDFEGKKGQTVLVEVDARRLGSKLRPVLHLYGPRQIQLAWSWTTPELNGDTRLQATLPEDGRYRITLHDAEYAAPGSSYFRLKVGQWSRVDQVFPPVVARDRRQVIEYLGPEQPRRTELAAIGKTGVTTLAWPGPGTWSGPRPFVLVSRTPEMVEHDAASKPQELPAGAVGVSGRLHKPYEEDLFQVPVTPGSKVRLEVKAERLGSPLDAALVVRNPQRGVLARSEDSPRSVDPVLEYAVPEKVTTVLVGVADTDGRGGPRGIYHLTIAPQGPTASATGDELVMPTQQVAIPSGGFAVLPVWANRKDHRGRIELSATALPNGVKVEGATITEDAEGTLVTLRNSPSSTDASVTIWSGRGIDGEERPVVIRGHPLERVQPWLASEVALATYQAKTAEFQVTWRDTKKEDALVPSRPLVLPVKVARPEPNGLVRLSLLSSQMPPMMNGQPNPAQAIRPEKVIDLGPKQNDADVKVLVPAELAAAVYDLSLQADLLAADNKTVLATAFAPVRRLPVRVPLVVRLDGMSRIQAVADAKKTTTVTLKGQVERRDGLKGDATITLAGLPATVRVEPGTVKADASAFIVNVVLPANFPAGELRGLKLFATAVADPAQPNVRVRSRDVEVTLVVQASAK